MLKSLINRNYIFYGGSIVISRGLEYFVLLFAAHHLTKNDYGELEYYKKFIEVGSNALAFGFPALILSYTKSRESKTYFYVLSLLFVLVLGGISSFIGLFSPIWFLLILTLIFYALFFNGGITQSYQLVQFGSNYASIYKIVISILFYISIFILIYYFDTKGNTYLYPSILLLPLALAFTILDLKKIKIEIIKLKKYWKLFRKLLYNSLTLVISNFANLLFLYTDIFIIKILSASPNNEIADFSFALNVASILLIVSMTLIQVEIEQLKKNSNLLFQLNKKIFVLSIALSLLLVILYYIIIRTNSFQQYNETFLLFVVILIGKIFLTLSNLFGTHLVILKKFRLNLKINLISLTFNILACFVGYKLFGLNGLAAASTVLLTVRFIILVRYNKGFLSLRK